MAKCLLGRVHDSELILNYLLISHFFCATYFILPTRPQDISKLTFHARWCIVWQFSSENAVFNAKINKIKIINPGHPYIDLLYGII